MQARGDLNVRQHILLVSVREPHNWDLEPLCIQPVLKLNSSGFLWTKVLLQTPYIILGTQEKERLVNLGKLY